MIHLLPTNQQILQQQVRDVTLYFAGDHAEVLDNQHEANNYPHEFLQTLTPYAMPPDTLEVKGWVHCYVAKEP